MELTDSYTNEIHLTLKTLIENKSKRDRTNFTIYQLAKALDMPHSILLRLVHPDPNKRVINPRIDTLAKIVEFFQADGFDVSLDDFLVGFKTKEVDVHAQKLSSFTEEKILPVYSFDKSRQKIGQARIKIESDANNLIALLSDEDIEPIFKAGSLFIINPNLEPEDDTLVAVELDGYHKILIRKFFIEHKQKLLKTYDRTQSILLSPTRHHSIIGVVIQINAKT